MGNVYSERTRRETPKPAKLSLTRKPISLNTKIKLPIGKVFFHILFFKRLKKIDLVNN